MGTCLVHAVYDPLVFCCAASVQLAAPDDEIRAQTMSNIQTSQGSEYVAPTHLTAAAGGLGGSWYVLLEGVANLIHEVCPALTITVVEGGGVLNHALVGSGQLRMDMMNH